jgi:molybdate transport system substrate-binding protein
MIAVRPLTVVLVAASAALALTGLPVEQRPGLRRLVVASAATSSTASITGTVNVFAAASLQETFSRLKKQFETTHPAVTVTPNFGASSALAQQINQGAPADVFASASQTNMDQVVQAGAGIVLEGLCQERHGDRRPAGQSGRESPR